ncbi:MAG: hypothetical protein KBA66_06890 [Leptospiraceae bacterium]|nr:hypothetical protein [Leptospiraceae bacterium]
MNKLFKILLIALLVLASGIVNCVQLHSIAINSQPEPKEREKQITAQTDKLVFLAFNFNNDFLDEAPKKLLEQCKDGKIKGIVSKFETVNYFLFIRYVIKASGYCVK